MKHKKIIVDLDVDNNMTFEEVIEQMVEAQEKIFETGPIIGEARDVIRHLCVNLFMRDALLDQAGISTEESISFFEILQELEEKRAKVILEKRAVVSKKPLKTAK